jgi:hypothetical protein
LRTLRNLNHQFSNNKLKGGPPLQKTKGRESPPGIHPIDYNAVCDVCFASSRIDLPFDFEVLMK